MKYDLAIVTDTGKYYTVLGTVKKSLDEIVNTEKKYLKLSYNAYEVIKEALADKKVVTIQKDMSTEEVMPGEIFISDDKETDLEVIKGIAVNKIHKKLEYKSVILSSLDVLMFTIINNELNSLGYFISNSNREEKYIEIIETENEDLINKLEEYLNILDKVMDIKSFSDVASSNINKIYKASDEKEIDSIISKFYDTIDIAYSAKPLDDKTDKTDKTDKVDKKTNKKK